MGESGSAMGETGSTPAETIIDADFAKTMVARHASDGEEGYRLVMDALDSLSKDELQRLKTLIGDDIKSGAGKIVAPAPVEGRLAHGLLNEIDDRLGHLDYDYVLDGHFLDYSGSGASITYYAFKTNQEKSVEVYVSVSTLLPAYGYQENYTDPVRIFVKAGAAGQAGYVVKIELVAP